MAARCATEAFSTTCAVMEDGVGWWPAVLGLTPSSYKPFHFLLHITKFKSAVYSLVHRPSNHPVSDLLEVIKNWTGEGPNGGQVLSLKICLVHSSK